MKKLEEFIEDATSSISTFKDNFYKDTITLHYNEKLRKLTQITELKKGFNITNSNSEEYLGYDKNGFVLYKKEYNGSWGFTGYTEEKFKVKRKKLYAKYYSKDVEMLEIFPKLTIKHIADALEQCIRKIDLYQKAIAQTAKDEEAKKALDKMLGACK